MSFWRQWRFWKAGTHSLVPVCVSSASTGPGSRRTHQRFFYLVNCILQWKTKTLCSQWEQRNLTEDKYLNFPQNAVLFGPSQPREQLWSPWSCTDATFLQETGPCFCPASKGPRTWQPYWNRMRDSLQLLPQDCLTHTSSSPGSPPHLFTLTLLTFPTFCLDSRVLSKLSSTVCRPPLLDTEFYLGSWHWNGFRFHSSVDSD